eukprot:Rhum_TRINITY_DN12902_c0_g1::Rhum_TRINITY_DN12902_c0_g1_i2::g.55351::m.55351
MGWLSDCAAPVAGLGRALCAFGQNQFLQGIQDTLSDTFGITVLSAAEPRCDMLGVSAAAGGAEDEGGDGMARILQQCLMNLREEYDPNSAGVLASYTGYTSSAVLEAHAVYADLVTRGYTGPALASRFLSYSCMTERMIRIMTWKIQDHEVVVFPVLMAIVAVCERGTPAERLTMVFTTFDEDGGGALTQEQITDIFAAVAGDAMTERDVEFAVDELFREINTNQDGCLQFYELITSYPMLVRLLRLDHTDDDDDDTDDDALSAGVAGTDDEALVPSDAGSGGGLAGSPSPRRSLPVALAVTSVSRPHTESPASSTTSSLVTPLHAGDDDVIGLIEVIEPSVEAFAKPSSFAHSHKLLEVHHHHGSPPGHRGSHADDTLLCVESYEDEDGCGGSGSGSGGRRGSGAHGVSSPSPSPLPAPPPPPQHPPLAFPSLRRSPSATPSKSSFRSSTTQGSFGGGRSVVWSVGTRSSASSLRTASPSGLPGAQGGGAGQRMGRMARTVRVAPEFNLCQFASVDEEEDSITTAGVATDGASSVGTPGGSYLSGAGGGGGGSSRLLSRCASASDRYFADKNSEILMRERANRLARTDYRRRVHLRRLDGCPCGDPDSHSGAECPEEVTAFSQPLGSAATLSACVLTKFVDLSLANSRSANQSLSNRPPSSNPEDGEDA